MYLPWLGGSAPPPPREEEEEDTTDGSDADIALTETMVHDLMHKNERLSHNLHSLQCAYDQLLASEVNGHGAGGQHKGRPE